MNSHEDFANTIVVGDVLDTLSNFPDHCVDVTVTSPPYNKRRHSFGWLVQTNGYSHFNDRMPEEEYQNWQVEVLDELYRVTKPGGSVFYNHKIRWHKGVMSHPYEWLTKSRWTIRQEIIWDRTLAANVRGWRFWQVDERIYWLYKPVGTSFVGAELEARHAKMGSIWRIKPTPRSNKHPAVFPIELPGRAIYSVGNDKSLTVLDPYCGLGTTLVAAKLLGHRYIGIDISPEYVSFALERLENCESERWAIDEEVSRHIVRDPFRNRKERGTVSWPFAPNPGRSESSDEDMSESGMRGEA